LFRSTEIKQNTFTLLEKFTAKYHISQKAIHYSELNIIISTITQLTLSWANAFCCNSWTFYGQNTHLAPERIS